MASNSEKNLLQQMMRYMEPPSDPSQMGTQILHAAPDLIKRIKKRRPKQCSDQFKVTAVQFFIHYYTLRMFALAPAPDPMQMQAMSMQDPMQDPMPGIDPEALEIFKNDQARDMEFAWRLLDSHFAAPQIESTAVLLKIEIGQRLESSVKLANALDNVSIPNIQTQMVSFTAAPLIGRWGKFIEIGATLPPLAFEQFSNVSQTMPVPDYTVLYQIAREENAAALPIPDPESLPWEQFHIGSIRVKFKDLNCEEFTEKRAELLEEIHQSEENVQWESVPNPNSIHLRRMGAIFQCISFSESPQQLCGIYKDDTIRVRGKTQAVMGPPEIDPELIMSGQVQVDPSQLQILIQEESWNLERDAENPNLFKGEYEMHNYTPLRENEKITDPDKAPLHMTFDLELTLVSVEELAALQQAELNGSKTLKKPAAEVERFITDIDELELD